MKVAGTIIWTGLVLVSGVRLFAATVVWSGLGTDNKWTAPGNWDGGDAPGAGDIAQFGAVGAGAWTTINLQGVDAISGLVVDGAAATNYTFNLCGGATLGRTLIATSNVARAKLEVNGCTFVTGADPIIIGNNERDNSGGGMQYGELTVANALVRNAADIARASHSYSSTEQYAILVGRNASGILRVQEGAAVSNKLQIGTGVAGTSGRGSGACTVRLRFDGHSTLVDADVIHGRAARVRKNVVYLRHSACKRAGVKRKSKPRRNSRL